MKNYVNLSEIANEIINTFQSSNPMCQAYFIEGIQGSRKTDLISLIENQLLKEKDWIVLNLDPTLDLLSDFSLKLVDSNNGIGLIYDWLGRIKNKNKKVLITIDGAIIGDNIRHFVSEFQIFLRRDYPVFLIITGIDEDISAIQNDPALTFLLRTPKVRI